MVTNGQITTKILKAAKTKTGEELRKEVRKLLNSFPLSSHKLVYDSDEKKVPAEAWAILIEECVASDQFKLERNNRFYAENGLKGLTTFGRAGNQHGDEDD